MKKLNNELYEIVKSSLQGDTPKERLQDIQSRIFMNNMIDRWQSEDYELNDVLYALQEETMKEMVEK